MSNLKKYSCIQPWQLTKIYCLHSQKKAPPKQQHVGEVAGETCGTGDELNSIGLDTKNVANDLSKACSCEISEDTVKQIIHNNLGHTVKMIEVNDESTNAMLSAMTNATAFSTSPPHPNAFKQIQTSTTLLTIEEDTYAHDPTAPNSPTTIAVLARRPGLADTNADEPSRKLLRLSFRCMNDS
jgi:hypothetical protein